jgi:hypothetical protein
VKKQSARQSTPASKSATPQIDSDFEEEIETKR